MIYVVGDPVYHKLNPQQKGTVIEVNNYYGWFKVRQKGGSERIYQIKTKDNETLWKLDLDRSSANG